jgi:hypothetical protein
LDKRRNWNFVITDDQSWIWRVSNAEGAMEQSAGTFATLKDCTADAMQHGYVAWRSEDERRRDLTLAVSKVLTRDGG